jgi:two-component system phosphate regulon sensor histidine kinase PhoR
MKLWQKVSFVCSIVLIVIVTTCSTLLIVQSKRSILTLTYEQAQDKQSNLAASFSQMASYYATEDDSESTTYALVKYCFSRFADETSVLMQEDVTLYSNVSIRPQDYLAFENSYDQRLFMGEIGGRDMLIVGSRSVVNQTDYPIFVVEDITQVYQDISAISIAGIAVGVVLIALLVRHSMQPLGQLGKTAKRIASGNYAERACVASRDEVGELAGDFNAMAAAVEGRIAELTETAERQRLFIGGVTHEFKTPLTTMILNADTLQNACMDEEETKTSVAFIQRQCQWLERLTQKLLKLITLKGLITKECVDLTHLFACVRESMAETLAQRGTPLIVDCGMKSLAMDADLMQSVLINLVDNASKASKPGQVVRISARDNTIEVADCGCGIPESELARITEPFYMVDRSRSKKDGGSGLGLALVKEIVAAHGADLRIESKFGGGTTVRIHFIR